MIERIDHLVIVVRDLERAAQDYRRLGFNVVAGGRHPVGSYNALIAFADGSYLEIIAFYRDALDHRWWEPLQRGERLVDYCLQTGDLGGDTKKLRAAGAAINDPVPWSRARPDGFELKWLLSLATGSHRGVAPFLIEDVTPRRERIPQQVDHENGAAGIDTLTVAVGELAPVERWYGALLGQNGALVERGDLGARGVRFQVGPHRLEFLIPDDPSSPLSDWMRRFGPSPYAATLLGREPRSLDPDLLHGAHLTFAGPK